MDASELRIRLKALGYTQRVAAEKLGLSRDGLEKQLYGSRPVSRQTEIILELREQLETPDPAQKQRRFEESFGVRIPPVQQVSDEEMRTLRRR